MSVLFIDFETRSAIDLKKRGLGVYAEDPSTDILCLGYCFDDEEVQIWTPDEVFLPIRVESHILSGGTVVGHNVNFEIQIWNEVGYKKFRFPKLNPEQTFCTMALCYSMALPGSLADAAPALGLTIEKDAIGHRVMMKLSQPRAIGGFCIQWWTDPVLYKRLYEYCKQDVEVERALYRRLLPLSEKERQVWLLDYKINQRGIQVDLPNVKKAIQIVESEKKRLDLEMREVTKGAVATCTATGQLTDWLNSKKIGVECESVDKSSVVDLLNIPTLPSDVRRALHLRQEAGKSSNAKLEAMLGRASSDKRLRGTSQYHGASTGRWAGRGLQPQNFPRGTLSPSEVREAISHFGDAEMVRLLYGPCLEVISSCLRGFIVPKSGHDLIACDLGSIESRVLCWLSGQENILELYRKDEDIYKYAASSIYNVSVKNVTKDQRQIGKVATLALGYQGGKSAFKTMAKGYGVVVSEKNAEAIKDKWRLAHPCIVSYWYEVERAAIKAVMKPGTKVSVGEKNREVTYLQKGSFLLCRLPSGRVIVYPYPKIESFETPWGATKQGLTYMGVDAVSKKFERQKSYGGLLVENITQAVARDVLVDGMLALEEKGYPIIFTCHDEIVCEVEKETFTKYFTVEEVERIMTTSSLWAKDLPLAAKGWRNSRYQK